MLNRDELSILMHDLKRVAKVIRLIKKEKDDEKRLVVTDLLIDEFDKVIEDLEKVTEKKSMIKNGTNFGREDKMPYINKEGSRRKELQDWNNGVAKTAGELNYQIFYFIKHCQPFDNVSDLKEHTKLVILLCINRFLGDNRNYQKYNDVMGVLVLGSHELNRRLKVDISEIVIEIAEKLQKEIDVYEDIKINENGDVE